MPNIFGKSPSNYAHLSERDSSKVESSDSTAYDVTLPTSASGIEQFVTNNTNSIRVAMQNEVDEVVHNEFFAPNLVPITRFTPITQANIQLTAGPAQATVAADATITYNDGTNDYIFTNTATSATSIAAGVTSTLTFHYNRDINVPASATWTNLPTGIASATNTAASTGQYEYTVSDFTLEDADTNIPDKTGTELSVSVTNSRIRVVYSYDAIWDAISEICAINPKLIQRASRNIVSTLYSSIILRSGSGGINRRSTTTIPSDDSIPTQTLEVPGAFDSANNPITEISSSDAEKIITYVKQVFGNNLHDIKLKVLRPGNVAPDISRFQRAWQQESELAIDSIAVDELSDRIAIYVYDDTVAEFPVAQMPTVSVVDPSTTTRTLEIDINYRYAPLVVKQPQLIIYVNNPKIAGGSTSSTSTSMQPQVSITEERLLPRGGTRRQALVKESDDDYDTEWADIAGSTDISTDSTLTGTGSTSSQLGIADSGVDITHLSSGVQMRLLPSTGTVSESLIPDSIARDTELFSGDYEDLANKPDIPDSFADLTGQVSDAQIPSSIARDSELFSGNYADLSNRPDIPDSFSDLTGEIADSQIPDSIARDSELFSKDYNDLTNRPHIPTVFFDVEPGWIVRNADSYTGDFEILIHAVDNDRLTGVTKIGIRVANVEIREIPWAPTSGARHIELHLSTLESQLIYSTISNPDAREDIIFELQFLNAADVEIASETFALDVIEPSEAETRSRHITETQRGRLLPDGGATGEVLKKSSNNDYETTWSTDDGLTTVSSDTTLTGDGTSGSPLSVANPFTDTDETKLDGIETGATADFKLPQKSKLHTKATQTQMLLQMMTIPSWMASQQAHR